MERKTIDCNMPLLPLSYLTDHDSTSEEDLLALRTQMKVFEEKMPP